MKRHKLKSVNFLFALLVFYRSPAIALNEPTHQIINEEATRQSGLDQILRDQVRFVEGIQQSIQGRRVFEWIGEGGIREDDGFRYFNHFHDPLRSWGTAGLPRLLGTNPSSIRWMQNFSSGWSWQNARDYYWTALTATTSSAREKAFADTFRALGQVMHLVVDASVPEHVRNDIHPIEGACRMIGIRCLGNYEYWVSDKHGLSGSTEETDFMSTYLTSPIGFAPSILQQPTDDSAAPVTVARLIDTDTYTGTESGPGVTLSPAIGIGEFANANFFSEDTIDGSYPFPNVSALQPSQISVPDTGKVFRYYKKGMNDGIPNDFAATECVLDQAARDQGAYSGPTYFCVDEAVWSRTAQEMLPRAVGYARGVLDYFFRGKVNSTFLSPSFTWVEWGTQSNSIRVDNVNVTVDGTNETGQGTMRLVLLFRGTDSMETFPPVIVSEPVSVSAGAAQTVVFPFSSLPYPATHPPVFGTYSAMYWGILVYKGSLGQESEAIVADGSCINPDGSRFARRYDFQHAIGITLTSGDWNESAYFEGC